MSNRSETFWAKVFFREYLSHYIEMTDGEIVEDVRKGIVALTKLDSTNESFGSKMVKWAIERMESKASKSSRSNGALGGRPRLNAGASPQNRQAGAAAKHLPNNSDARQSQVEAREGQDAHGYAKETSVIKRPTPKRIQTFREPTLTEMYDFCDDNGLDSSYGREWFELHMARNWKMKDGAQMLNWKAALKRYCIKKQKGDNK